MDNPIRPAGSMVHQVIADAGATGSRILATGSPPLASGQLLVIPELGEPVLDGVDDGGSSRGSSRGPGAGRSPDVQVFPAHLAGAGGNGFDP